MFNRTTYIDAGYRSASHVTVTEKRAPTDESVKLLKEMEEKAREKVINSIVVADTSFECKIQKSVDMLSMQDVYFVVYKMNGLKRTVQIRVNQHERLNAVETAQFIRDQVAFDIANEMIGNAIVESMR